MLKDFSRLKELVGKKQYCCFYKVKKQKHTLHQMKIMKMKITEELIEWFLTFTSAKIAEKIINMLNEIIDNCIYYAVLNKKITFIIKLDSNSFQMETINSTRHENKDKLKEILDYIAYSNKKLAELYMEEIMQAAINKEAHLGIIRVMMETGSNIELLDSENDVVHLKLTAK